MEHLDSLEELSNNLMYDIDNDNITTGQKYLLCLKYYETMASISQHIDDFDLSDLNNFDKNDANAIREVCYSISARITALKFISKLPKKHKNIIVEEVKLNEDWRTKVRTYISVIKSEVLQSGLNEAIKNSILKKLSTFELEIEKETTNLQSFNYAVMDITYSLSIGCENLKKPLDLLTKLVRVFAKIHSIEHPVLPSPEDTKLLPPPEE